MVRCVCICSDGRQLAHLPIRSSHSSNPCNAELLLSLEIALAQARSWVQHAVLRRRAGEAEEYSPPPALELLVTRDFRTTSEEDLEC